MCHFWLRILQGIGDSRAKKNWLWLYKSKLLEMLFSWVCLYCISVLACSWSLHTHVLFYYLCFYPSSDLFYGVIMVKEWSLVVGGLFPWWDFCFSALIFYLFDCLFRIPQCFFQYPMWLQIDAYTIWFDKRTSSVLKLCLLIDLGINIFFYKA